MTLDGYESDESGGDECFAAAAALSSVVELARLAAEAAAAARAGAEDEATEEVADAEPDAEPASPPAPVRITTIGPELLPVFRSEIVR